MTDKRLVVADAPATGRADFDFDRIASTLRAFIRAIPPEDPFAICVSGGWGSGKTTLLRQLERGLAESAANDGRRSASIWFEPWKLASESEVRNVLTWKVLDLIARDADFMTGAGISIDRKNVLRMVSERLLRVDSDAVLTNFRAETQTRDTYAETEGIFRRVADLYLRPEGDQGHQLVVFVDDLDRCRPARVVEVLEAVKQFFDLPGIVFVFAVDNRQLVGALRDAYGYDERNARTYLEKMFQLTFPLPRKGADGVGGFLRDRLAEIGVDGADLDDELLSALVDRFGRNLRNLKLFTNSFSFQRELLGAEQRQEVALFKWLYLEATMPVTVDAAVRHDQLDLVVALEFLAYGGCLHSAELRERYASGRRGRALLGHVALIVTAIVGDRVEASLTATQEELVSALRSDGSILETLPVLRAGSGRLLDADLHTLAGQGRALGAMDAEPGHGGSQSDVASILPAARWSNLGDSLDGDKQHALSYFPYLYAHLLEPEAPRYLADVTRALRGTGRLRAAKALMRRCHELAPDHRRVMLENAYLEDIYLGNLALSNTFYRRTRELGSDLVTVRGNLANNLKKLGNLRQAFYARLEEHLLSPTEESRGRVVRDAALAGIGSLGDATDADLARMLEEGKASEPGVFGPVTEHERDEIRKAIASYPVEADEELSRAPV